MAQVLVVHHTVSPTTAELLAAAQSGLAVEELADVEVTSRPALACGASEVLAADGVVLLTPVNIGYLSGAMKHFFDQVYYPCLDATRGLPYAAVLHSGSDAAGALRALAAITTGMGWRAVGAPLVVTGPADPAVRESVADLAATVGAYAVGAA